MMSKGERIAIVTMIGLFGGMCFFLKLTWKDLPAKEMPPELHGWNLGTERPPSSLIGQPLSYLRYEYFPERVTQITAVCVIRNGIMGWYMPIGVGEEVLIDAPDYWIELPPEVSR